MKNPELYPSFFARFYDTIYHSVRDSTDHEYFLEKMLDTKGPVLEVGVGTGRFFTDALEKGVDIYGIDVSPAMIDVLLDKVPNKEHHRVQLADMCTFDPGRKYARIIAPFRVFMHLLTIEKQSLFLKNMHRLLDPGATLIFDLFVPNLKMLADGLDQVKDFEGEYAPGQKLVRYSTMHADPVFQLSTVTFRMEWQEDGTWHSDTWTTRMKMTFYAELVHLVKQSPFKQFTIFGDFDESPLNSKSKEFIMHCTR
jgi:SAM-dependent methyltransferase